MEEENKLLKECIKTLQDEISALKDHLSKYTNPNRTKKYYEANKERIIARNSEYAKNKKNN